jgi:hypothetical protein
VESHGKLPPIRAVLERIRQSLQIHGVALLLLAAAVLEAALAFATGPTTVRMGLLVSGYNSGQKLFQLLHIQLVTRAFGIKQALTHTTAWRKTHRAPAVLTAFRVLLVETAVVTPTLQLI